MVAFDVAANLPLDLIALAVPEAYRAQALSILRLNRVLRLNYLYQFYELKGKVLMIHKVFLKVR